MAGPGFRPALALTRINIQPGFLLRANETGFRLGLGLETFLRNDAFHLQKEWARSATRPAAGAKGHVKNARPRLSAQNVLARTGPDVSPVRSLRAQVVELVDTQVSEACA